MGAAAHGPSARAGQLAGRGPGFPVHELGRGTLSSEFSSGAFCSRSRVRAQRPQVPSALPPSPAARRLGAEFKFSPGLHSGFRKGQGGLEGAGLQRGRARAAEAGGL